jgi:hypothetical protein
VDGVPVSFEPAPADDGEVRARALLHRERDERHMLLVGQRGGLAGGPGDHDAVRAVVGQVGEQRDEGVLVDAAVRPHRGHDRRQDGSQVGHRRASSHATRPVRPLVPPPAPRSVPGHPAAVLALTALEVRTVAARPPDPALRGSGAAALAALRADRPRLHDGRLLVLDELRDGVLTVREGGYFDHVAIGLAVAAIRGAGAGLALAGATRCGRHGPQRRIGVSVACV